MSRYYRVLASDSTHMPQWHSQFSTVRSSIESFHARL